MHPPWRFGSPLAQTPEHLGDCASPLALLPPLVEVAYLKYGLWSVRRKHDRPPKRHRKAMSRRSKPHRMRRRQACLSPTGSRELSRAADITERTKRGVGCFRESASSLELLSWVPAGAACLPAVRLSLSARADDRSRPASGLAEQQPPHFLANLETWWSPSASSPKVAAMQSRTAPSACLNLQGRTLMWPPAGGVVEGRRGCE